MKFLDILLTVIHLAILFFNLFGWIWPSLRRLHLIVVLTTAFCWLILGMWYGIGYCPVTDWQWKVKERLGQSNLPSSFVTYCLYGIGFKSIPVNLINILTAVLFSIAGAIALYFNFFHEWLFRKKRHETTE
jgi:hypothetical protein